MKNNEKIKLITVLESTEPIDKRNLRKGVYIKTLNYNGWNLITICECTESNRLYYTLKDKAVIYNNKSFEHEFKEFIFNKKKSYNHIQIYKLLPEFFPEYFL